MKRSVLLTVLFSILLVSLFLCRWGIYLLFEELTPLEEVKKLATRESVHRSHYDDKSVTAYFSDESDSIVSDKEVYIVYNDKVIFESSYEDYFGVRWKDSNNIVIDYKSNSESQTKVLNVNRDRYGETRNIEYTKKHNIFFVIMIISLTILFVGYIYIKKRGIKPDKKYVFAFSFGLPIGVALLFFLAKEISEERIIGLSTLHIICEVVTCFTFLYVVYAIKLKKNMPQNSWTNIALFVSISSLICMLLICLSLLLLGPIPLFMYLGGLFW